MRPLRVIAPEGFLHGSRHYPRGSIVEIAEDRFAARLVELKHAEFVSSAAVERAVAPKAPERAVAKGNR